jgi:inner membrane protein
MDSLTHASLGAAIGVVVLGSRVRLPKAAAWCAVCATLPDVDVFVDHGDPILNMTLHRGPTHSLLYLCLLAVPLAWIATHSEPRPSGYLRWLLALGLALLSHPLLDFMTVYGTRLALPFSDESFALGSVFIVDPLVTLPLAAGVLLALATGSQHPRTATAVGLGTALLYLAWTAGAQQHVRVVATRSLERRHISASALLVTPTPLNSLVWRVVAMTPSEYYEGFFSLLHPSSDIALERHRRDVELYEELRFTPAVVRMSSFTHGFVAVDESGGVVRVKDLRMGMAPDYPFTFVIAHREHHSLRLASPESDSFPPDALETARVLWQLLLNQHAQAGVVTPPSVTARSPLRSCASSTAILAGCGQSPQFESP